MFRKFPYVIAYYNTVYCKNRKGVVYYEKYINMCG